MNLPVRCSVSGHEIKAGEPVMRILEGCIDTEGRFIESNQWGVIKLELFLKALSSPKLVIKELERLSKL